MTEIPSTPDNSSPDDDPTTNDAPAPDDDVLAAYEALISGSDPDTPGAPSFTPPPPPPPSQPSWGGAPPPPPPPPRPPWGGTPPPPGGVPSHGAPPSGPPVGTATTAPARRLVRDPYTRFGGVASGIAHYFGIDVTVVRIAFILFTFFTGSGIILYLAGWVLMPRADHWPPPPGGEIRSLQSLNGRELGIGLAALGLIVALAVGGSGAAGGFLIPVILIGGGIWLLAQPASDAQPAANGSSSGATPPPFSQPATTVGRADTTLLTDEAGQADTVIGDAAIPGGDPFSGATGTGSWSGDATWTGTTSTAGPSGGTPYGAPVPPRRRRRGVLLGILFGVLGVFVVLAMLIAGVVFWAVNEYGDPVDVLHDPSSIDDPDFPNAVTEQSASVTIDLTDISAAEFTEFAEQEGEPVEIEADVEVGEIVVIVPAGVETEVTAHVGAGEIHVFGQSQDGIGNSVSSESSDPDLLLDLDLTFGEITVAEDEEAA